MSSKSKLVFAEVQRAKAMLSLAMNSDKPSTFVRSAIDCKSILSGTKAMISTIRTEEDRIPLKAFVDSEMNNVNAGVDSTLEALDKILGDKWPTICGPTD